MGSEMCIRDRIAVNPPPLAPLIRDVALHAIGSRFAGHVGQVGICLLYTSDAADERSSVDLGGRRIIKKKQTDKKHSATNHIIITKATLD